MSVRGRGRSNAKAMRWNRTGVCGLRGVHKPEGAAAETDRRLGAKGDRLSLPGLVKGRGSRVPTGGETGGECLGAGNNMQNLILMINQVETPLLIFHTRFSNSKSCHR